MCAMVRNQYIVRYQKNIWVIKYMNKKVQINKASIRLAKNIALIKLESYSCASKRKLATI